MTRIQTCLSHPQSTHLFLLLLLLLELLVSLDVLVILRRPCAFRELLRLLERIGHQDLVEDGARGHLKQDLVS